MKAGSSAGEIQGRRHPLLGLVLLAGGVGAMYLALFALAHLPCAPWRLQRLLGGGEGGAGGWAMAQGRIAALATLAVYLAVAPACAVRVLVRRPQHLWVLSLWAAAVTVPAWFLLGWSLDAQDMEALLGRCTLYWPAGWEHFGRFLALAGAMVQLAIMGGAIVGALWAKGWASSLKYALALLLLGLPGLVLARLIVVPCATTDSVARPLRGGPVPGEVSVMILSALLSANAAALGHAWHRPRAGRILLVLAVTAALVLPGFMLADRALATRPATDGRAVSGLAWLLEGQDPGKVGAMSVFLRWSAAQVALVAFLSYGHLAALCLLAGRGGAQAPPEAQTPTGTAERRGQKDLPVPPAHPGRVCLVVLLVYAALVIYASMVPLNYRYHAPGQAWNRLLNTRHHIPAMASRSDVAANVLLFVPLTFLAMGASTKEGTLRGGWALAPLVAIVAGVLSGCIELAQVYFPPRVVSLSDVAAESAGGIVGIVLWFVFGRRITRWARALWQGQMQYRQAAGEAIGPAAARQGRPRPLRGRLAIMILAGYVVVLTFYQLMPLDLTISPAEVYHKYKEDRVTLVPFSDRVGMSRYIVAAKVALLIPVGMLFSLPHRGGGRGLLAAAGYGLLYAAGLETAQLLVRWRYTSATDVVLGTAGAILGGVWSIILGPDARYPLRESAFWRRCGRWIKLAAAIAWALWLLWDQWRPFDFTWPEGGVLRRAIAALRVPLYYLYSKSEFEALTQVARGFGWFLILGMLVRSLWPLERRDGIWKAATLVCGFVLGIEAGQLFLPDRVPDMTNILVAAAGGSVGAALLGGLARVFLQAPFAADPLPAQRVQSPQWTE